jgi:hypothetical protein
MLYRNSEIKATKAKRLAQLNERLQALTEGYRAFFGGFYALGVNGGSSHVPQSATILTDLQFLRRTQFAATERDRSVHPNTEVEGANPIKSKQDDFAVAQFSDSAALRPLACSAQVLIDEVV